MRILILTIMALTLASASAQRLSPLASPPNWSQLDEFQHTMTQVEFQRLLDQVYAPGGAWKEIIEIRPELARIRTSPGGEPYELRFARADSEARPVPRYWRSRVQLGEARPDRPLEGLKIAIDPGHLGGKFARMEERWFQIGNSKPVTEGDMTLLVAKLLVPQLEALGAKVYLTRSRPVPVTNLRPEKLKNEAREILAERKQAPTERGVQLESEKLFYRVGEIRRRAQLINERIRPDLVLCLHFNAETWGNPDRPSLTDVNHLHFLVNGAYSAVELDHEDIRFNMLRKLLNRSLAEEVAVSDAVAKSMAEATQLPAFEYKGSNAVRVNDNPYVWARNLLANRLFECPVVFPEPYVMNSREVFERIQLGDYHGRRNVRGRMVPSIYREYADSLTQGLVNYYSKR